MNIEKIIPKKGDTMYAVGIFSKGLEVVETSFYGTDHDFFMLAENRLFYTKEDAEKHRYECEAIVAELKERV